MIPAPLLLRLREHRGQRTPDPEVTIADHHLRRRQSAPCEVPQDRRPALRRLPIAALDGEDHQPLAMTGVIRSYRPPPPPPPPEVFRTKKREDPPGEAA